jgi:hypothetical protein
MHGDIVFMSKKQISKVTQPCKGAVAVPSSAITSKFASVLRPAAFSPLAMGPNQIPLGSLELFTKRITVVSAIGNQRERIGLWTGDLDTPPSTRLSSAGDTQAVNHSLAISHPHSLGSLTSLGFQNVQAIF